MLPRELNLFSREESNAITFSFLTAERFNFDRVVKLELAACLYDELVRILKLLPSLKHLENFYDGYFWRINHIQLTLRVLHETEKVLDVLDIHVRADVDGDKSFVSLLNLAPTSQVKRVHFYCEDFRFDKLRVTTSKSGILTCRVQHPRYTFKNLDIDDGY